MGKKNFSSLYKQSRDELGNATLKVSSLCDAYNPSGNYAGLIVYHHGGKFKWKNTKGVAKGYNCRSFYILIQCTDEWKASDFRRAGQGYVHDKVYTDVFGCSFQKGQTCCGGFAVMRGVTKCSSSWLNDQSSCKTSRSWKSDGNKDLSYGERTLVELGIEAWKRHGSDQVASIPFHICSLAPTRM